MENPHEYSGHPNLVRTSSLDPDYIRKNLSLVNSPVKLLFERDTMEMTQDWTEEEKKYERRLVKFNFVKLSPTEYLVKFRPIKKSEFTNDAAIISCILWKEKELHIVTSVDIILILEYLVQENFTIEEKNRVRRNLQSLKPYTISRSNKNYQRFFRLLMSMEDPRPRNIEKDLKVFKWSDLFSALNKVISKYSTSSNHLEVQQIEPGSVKTEGKPEFSIPPNAMLPPTERKSPPKSTQPSQHESFLPFERLKIMKKKLNHQLASLPMTQKHRAFQNAIAPREPVHMDIDEANNEEHSQESLNGRSNGYSNGHSNVGANEHSINMNGSNVKREPKLQGDSMDVDTEDSNSSAGDSTSTYAMTSSDEQTEDPPSNLQHKNSASTGNGSISSVSGSGYGYSGNMSGSASGSGLASGSGFASGSGESGGSTLFSNPRENNTTTTTVPGSSNGTLIKDSNTKVYNNINSFAQDQSDRMFGNLCNQTGTIQQISEHLPQYYQYPKSSQLHYDATEKGPPVNLPSLETYFHTNNEKINQANGSRVKLPPLVNTPKTMAGRKLSNPDALIDFSKNSSNHAGAA